MSTSTTRRNRTRTVSASLDPFSQSRHNSTLATAVTTVSTSKSDQRLSHLSASRQRRQSVTRATASSLAKMTHGLGDNSPSAPSAPATENGKKNLRGTDMKFLRRNRTQSIRPSSELDATAAKKQATLESLQRHMKTSKQSTRLQPSRTQSTTSSLHPSSSSSSSSTSLGPSASPSWSSLTRLRSSISSSSSTSSVKTTSNKKKPVITMTPATPTSTAVAPTPPPPSLDRGPTNRRDTFDHRSSATPEGRKRNSGGEVVAGIATTRTPRRQSHTPATVSKIPTSASRHSIASLPHTRHHCHVPNASTTTTTTTNTALPMQSIPGYMRPPMCEACNKHARPVAPPPPPVLQSTAHYLGRRRSLPLLSQDRERGRPNLSEEAPRLSLLRFQASKLESCKNQATPEPNNNSHSNTYSGVPAISQVPPLESSSSDDDNGSPVSPMSTACWRRRGSGSGSDDDQGGSDRGSFSTGEADRPSDFVQLITTCVAQSTKLERISVELLGSEKRLTELLETQEPFAWEAREARYEQGIRECNALVTKQAQLIDRMEGLLLDSHGKVAPSFKISDTEAVTATSSTSVYVNMQSQQSSYYHLQQWQASATAEDEKRDLALSLRWAIGQLVGGTTGTGMVVAQRKARRGKPSTLLIVGSCTTTEAGVLPPHLTRQDSRRESLYHHQYIIEITGSDRKRRFQKLSGDQWVSDDTANHCEFSVNARKCTTQFDWFNRRHHCRSSNRLILFDPQDKDKGEWLRVCDGCFYKRMVPFLRPCES
ncbi:uncharacterized protein BYT42DRAFT_614930 [Radiomyces spectabilis]|uniref:uncharacterized protein n=1 Tax=Radiomyces spectabilis TaxID=64574 RepID=UPI002220F4E2|nr:uncharacterized protein BYT42DRAFT_614930 [Radiomyces spectabilis]KAI8376149.1 hypothetical protein BYT42DRAFT_614930 [Radiomyces spectabilis]